MLLPISNVDEANLNSVIEELTKRVHFLDPPDIQAPLLKPINDNNINNSQMKGKENHQPAPPDWNPPPIPKSDEDEIGARNIRDPSEGLYEEPEGIYTQDSHCEPTTSNNITTNCYHSPEDMPFKNSNNPNDTTTRNGTTNESKENSRNSHNHQFTPDMGSVYVRKTNRGTYFIQPSTGMF
uniref:WW domain-containing protein n=1 Tax=Parastrongyloides trichosuri TaxID=131310 RepID=A0A0N5A1X4_PARTI